MSVSELKAQADRLSFEEVSELARHVRSLALCKDPKRRSQLQVAEQSNDRLSQAEFEQALDDLERSGR